MLVPISACSHSSDEPAELCILTSLCCSHTQSFVCLIYSLHSSQNFSVMLGHIFLGARLMCHAQGHNAVTPVGFEPTTPRSLHYPK